MPSLEDLNVRNSALAVFNKDGLNLFENDPDYALCFRENGNFLVFPLTIKGKAGKSDVEIGIAKRVKPDQNLFNSVIENDNPQVRLMMTEYIRVSGYLKEYLADRLTID